MMYAEFVVDTAGLVVVSHLHLVVLLLSVCSGSAGTFSSLVPLLMYNSN
jgi:hypothetical protein